MKQLVVTIAALLTIAAASAQTLNVTTDATTYHFPSAQTGVMTFDNSLMTIVLGELLVVVVEALWYYLFLRVWSRAFIYSILCNAISFLTGLLVQLLIVYFQHN